MRALRLAALAGLLLTLGLSAGCGFHLRGSRDLPVASVQVVDAGGAPALAAEVRRHLQFRGVRVTDASPGAVVRLSGEGIEQHVLSVDANTGKVREFELDYSVTVALADAAGQAVGEPERLSVTRDYTFDETAVLGKFEERHLLEQQLREDVAEAVVRRLYALRARP